jgi:uncharacterized alkaline shock family protein YloU
MTASKGQASISADILARYAADAAREVEGVRALPGRKSVRVEELEGSVRVEVHVVADWGASLPDVGTAVQARVRDYLGSMADLRPLVVDVVVDDVGPLDG